jgi:tetratricopeptide (TPR) repeat protein
MPTPGTDLQQLADSIAATLQHKPVEDRISSLIGFSKTHQYANPALSMELVNRAAKLAEGTDNPLLIANTLNARAIINFYLGNNNEAVVCILKSIDYVEQYVKEEPDSIFLVQRLIAMYGNAGNIYQAMGELDSALDMLLDALKMSEERMAIDPGNLNAMASHINILNNTAVVYQNLVKTKKAEELLQEALKIGRELDTPQAILPTLNNIGLIRIDQEQYKEAIEIYNEALGLGMQVADSMGISGNYNNLGLIYERLGENRKALSYYLASLDITRRLGFSIGITNTCANVGRLYNELNMPDSAIYFAKTGIDEAIRSGNDTYLMKNYETLASIYEKTGDFESALSMEKNFTSVKDRIFNAKKNRQIEEMEAHFETEKKEKENQILRQDIEIQRRNSILLIVGLAVMIIFAVLLYYFYRLKNKTLVQRTKLFEQQHQLQELEKGRLGDQLFAEQEINKLQNEKLEHQNRELSTRILHSINKNEAMNNIIHELEQLKNADNHEIDQCFIKVSQIVQDNISFDKDWDQFKLHFEEVNPGFFYKLQGHCPDLSQNEQKLCAYYRINLDTKEIARILNVSPSAVQKGRHRLRKKMNIPSETELPEFMSRF